MRRQRIIPVAENTLRKIAGIKFLYVHIAMLLLILVGPVFIFTITFIEKDILLWDTKAIIYLRKCGYELEFNLETDRERTKWLLYDTHEVIPYYTEEEAWPLSHFWDKWIKWPMWLLSGLVVIVLLLRVEIESLPQEVD